MQGWVVEPGRAQGLGIPCASPWEKGQELRRQRESLSQDKGFELYSGGSGEPGASEQGREVIGDPDLPESAAKKARKPGRSGEAGKAVVSIKGRCLCPKVSQLRKFHFWRGSLDQVGRRGTRHGMVR